MFDISQPEEPARDPLAGFFIPKNEAGHKCVEILRIIFPSRLYFKQMLITEVGFYIKRIGFEKTAEIARWSTKIKIKDKRYEKCLSVCAKHWREKQAQDALDIEPQEAELPAPASNEKHVRVNFNVPQSLHKKIKKLAHAKEMTASDLLRFLVCEAIKKQPAAL